jgi:hypothetical protein
MCCYYYYYSFFSVLFLIIIIIKTPPPPNNESQIEERKQHDVQYTFVEHLFQQFPSCLGAVVSLVLPRVYGIIGAEFMPSNEEITEHSHKSDFDISKFNAMFLWPGWRY